MTFSAAEHDVWTRLYQPLAMSRRDQAHPTFAAGLTALAISAERIPDLVSVNQRLAALTGFRGVYAPGLLEAKDFFAGLARREFPIGRFIRDARDLTYTPAPDVFHDLYGHLPFLADRDYADFCQKFGAAAMHYFDDSVRLRQFETLFWFGVEFPLIETPRGRRIFGGGILSSKAECDYALSPTPTVLPFDVDAIRHTPYRIDQMQAVLFLLKEPAELYGCLPRFLQLVENDA